MSGLRVRRGDREITVPIEIESEGGQILADYEAAAFAALEREPAVPPAKERDA
ncbi:MAG TPA: hypothetical protein PK594_02570 [Mycobacterium sp.]|nr:hypothetical protein [Mycobacterium sp.]